MRTKVQQGIVMTYTHFNNRVGSMVEVHCDTDFASNTEEMKNFAHVLAMQVAAMNPVNREALLSQALITDKETKVGAWLDKLRGQLKEKIEIKQFIRWELPVYHYDTDVKTV